MDDDYDYNDNVGGNGNDNDDDVDDDNNAADNDDAVYQLPNTLRFPRHQQGSLYKVIVCLANQVPLLQIPGTKIKLQALVFSGKTSLQLYPKERILVIDVEQAAPLKHSSKLT